MNKKIYFVKLTIKIETSSHGGYCSGEECDYEAKTVDLRIPYQPKDDYHWWCRARGTLLNHNDSLELFKKEINDYEVDCGWGSYYCGLSENCEKNGLERHDFRKTLLRAEYDGCDDEKCKFC